MTEQQAQALDEAAQAFNAVLLELHDEGADVRLLGQLFAGLIMVFATSPAMLRLLHRRIEPVFKMVSDLHARRFVRQDGMTPYQALNLIVFAGRCQQQTAASPGRAGFD